MNFFSSQLLVSAATLLTFSLAVAAPLGCPDSHYEREDASNILTSQSLDDNVMVSSVLYPPTSQFLSDSGIRWPIGVGAIVDDRGKHLATATLISESHILTVAHALDNAESRRFFILGHAIVASKSGTPRPVHSDTPGILCFKLSPNIIASVRGYLDYAVIALEKVSARNVPAIPTFNLLPISSVSVKVGDSAHIIGLYEGAYEPVPVSGLTLLSGGTVGGRFSRVGRYSKDAGTAIQVDYWLETQPGHSGSPILDGKARWVGMHQRNLNAAKCETGTPWHPYISEYYFDNFGGADSTARLESACSGKVEPDVTLLSKRKVLLPNGSNLPRQGSLLVDIAINIKRNVGADWLCENIPQFLALLNRRRIDSADCKSVEFKKALDRMRLE